MLRTALLLFVLGLAACGMRGPLELPPGPAADPLLKSPKPTKPAQMRDAADANMDTTTNP